MKDLTCFKAGKGFTVFLLITLLTILFVNPTYAGTQLKTQDLKPKIAKLNIPFIVNQGQTDEDVKFYANTFGGTVFITKEGSIVYSLPRNEKTKSPSTLVGEGWGGACSGTGTCTVTMDANKTVTVTFDLQTLPSTPSQSQGHGSGTNNQGTSNAPGLQNASGVQNAPGLQKK